MQARANGLYGPSIQVDPSFPYYQDRSPESIAEEIQLAGYDVVHYFVVNENIVNREVIDAFHARGMFVWAMVIGNGSFSTERFPEEWPEWQMGVLRPVEDGFWRFSHFSEGYRNWKKKAMAELVTRYPFDGIEIAEPYFPEWGGVERGVYGDVGPHAAKAFYSAYGEDMPDFEDEASPRHYKKVPDVYEKWIQFRVDAVNGFIDEMMNGLGGVRDVRPGIKVATWSLAVDDGEDSLLRLRETQGLLASSMISQVKPDLHYLQTHWPDWGRGDLPADYVCKYAPFVEEIRSMHPDLPLGVQADIGSARSMVKGREWWNAFKDNVKQLGYSTFTAYEYHIGGYMYEDLPVPVKAYKATATELIISFNKRISLESVKSTSDKIKFRDAKAIISVHLRAVEVDGNRLILHSDSFPDHGFLVEFSAIHDTPDLWLYPDAGVHESPFGTWIQIDS
ncbi:hypothetical protein Back11_07820 [Paenibacillus baekrokdamisoli]|uniref:Uncharacterized protein n=1 Tax=Paenibacillus baekrokdamisoli TaxID=1712516 RepID=A0A3G9IKI3_9BACL|nr:N-acyl-D-glucosamine 2-epimerase [Paenibacillus baekrokdamisoli]MBB3067376.1 hypothetical protein [Paenibacillus baekrokdamisoli]BBH19437.1 hypothetical protein Back11_07820 [Paenibacillus baekrokdamisoli]